MKQLPEEFVRRTRKLMGDELFDCFMRAFDEEPPVSIRLNPAKVQGMPALTDGVPWCQLGCYLPRRPNFTFDPLLHAGCYYVQEAASMFIHHILRQYVDHPVDMADFCAAPGGKSTCAISALPQGSSLWSNDPVRTRASILSENIQKWGYDGCTVTCCKPEDYVRTGLAFDVILCDVPCSGEGMFRKDAETIGEWSPQQVEKCWQLQRQIADSAWQCLRPGGLLIYSTCTFNTKENEENVRWICEQLGAELLPVATEPEWNITGSLLRGFDGPVYRFIPGVTRSEGLFVAVMRKSGQASAASLQTLSFAKEGKGCAKEHKNRSSEDKGRKGRNRKEQAERDDLNALPRLSFGEEPKASVALDYPAAISYLRGEAIVLPEGTPRGLLTVSFLGHPLGMVKNIGPRANNLYPKEWRIKSTHIPEEYEAILRLA